MCVYLCVRLLMHTHEDACKIPILNNSFTCTYMLTHIHAHMHAHTDTHMHTHTHYLTCCKQLSYRETSSKIFFIRGNVLKADRCQHGEPTPHVFQKCFKIFHALFLFLMFVSLLLFHSEGLAPKNETNVCSWTQREEKNKSFSI